MPVDLIDKVDRMADIQHRDRSNMIVHIVALYMETLEKMDDPERWETVENGWLK
jgi:metal-responsive CopG/Arc/MetJ family transcriptional regulator